ncbi:copper transporter [Saccharothrix australiensis]|uniref:Copper transport outer membrane protein MctB n=1 Tax=Saccharothrix australiensis TaxID=2072 RepID=A0A495W6A3_9PSEU|nr:copper transporter [Saccharothrix australiensis]RKT56607.1 copper transport outer membrane protein MctB [Saccharothrix australiensis]
MISMRYHIVSLTAVFLALAVGVVLGSTAISGRLLSGLTDDNSALGEEVADLRAERTGLTAKLAEADRFAKSIGPLAVKGTLAERTVVLVTTADAEPGERDALAELLRASGATVTGEVQLTDSFTDPRKADQLRDLVARLQPAGTQLPTGADPGTRAGGLLGAVLLVNKDTGQPQSGPDEAAAALTGLASAGFVTVSPGLRAAQLAVVLTGGAVEGDSAGDRAAVVGRFATQLDRSGAGVVLAGGDGSAEGSGAVGVVRADTAATSVLSTVDNAGTAAGRVVVVLALREQLEGKSGRYGVGGNAESAAPGVVG